MSTKTEIRSTGKSRIREHNPILNTITFIVMVIVVLACVIPFLYIIARSFSSAAAITNSRVYLWPVEFTLEAYKSVYEYPNFFRAYGYTFLYTIAVTGISLFMMVLFAYPLSKDWLKGQGVVMKLVVFSMFFSGGLIPNFLLINSLHLVGTVWAMLLPYAINQFNLIILINFFKSLPSEIEEAAVIDGLSYFGILARIVLPLSGAALATVGLYTAVFFWNNWFGPLIYLKSSQYPVMMLLRNIVNGRTMIVDNGGMGEKSSLSISIKSAVIILSSLPIILIYPFLQKYFVKGMTVGAVKG
ncbi:MAG: carbohydrate ABC transporter permease [Clostridia bacterium]|nr:carbohydrate ABC transporter permease [Clostridia bacterium]